MKSKIVKTGVGILILGCCLGGGYYAGRQTNSDEVKPVAVVKEEKPVKEKLYDTSLIAIVNADEGIKKQDKVVSYSQSLLGTLNLQYEITGIEDAKQGIENGKYSAYIILPGTFSESVESINSTPQKAVLEYAIAQNLTQAAQAKAIYSVGNAYTALNNGISELYLSSVLSEVHKVQDAAGTIKDNDIRDLKALGEVAGDDLTETIQLPELTSVDKKIEVLDLVPHYEEEDKLLAEIGRAYEESWAKGEEQFDNTIKEQSSDLTESLKKENGVTAEYEKMLTMHGQEMEIPQYADDTEAERNEVTTHVKNIENKLNDLSQLGDLEKAFEELKTKQLSANTKNTNMQASYSTIKEALSNSIVDQGTEKSPEGEEIVWTKYQVYDGPNVEAFVEGQEAEKIAYANQKLQEYYNGILNSENFSRCRKSWIDMYKKLSTIDSDTYPVMSDEELNAMVDGFISMPTVEPVPNSGTATLNPISIRTIEYTSGIENPDWNTLKFPELNQATIMDDVNNILSTSETYTKNRLDEISKSRDRLVEKDVSVRESLDSFDDAYSNMLKVQGDLEKSINEYAPGKYLDNTAIGGLQQSLAKTQDTVKDKIETQNKQYEDYVEEVYKVSEENTRKQTESIEAGEKASNEKLESSLANAKNSKQTSYEDNKRMLNDIGGVLPYSRLGTQENIMAYRFMSEPLAVNDLTIAKNDPVETEEVDNNLPENKTDKEKPEQKNISLMVIAIPVVLILLCVGVYIISRKKHNDSQEDHL